MTRCILHRLVLPYRLQAEYVAFIRGTGLYCRNERDAGHTALPGRGPTDDCHALDLFFYD